MATSKDLYRALPLQSPSLEELKTLSDKMGLRCTMQEIQTVQDQVQSLAKSYQVLERYPQPTLPVKYPRTPGFRPRNQDNPYNAWYWRCDIKGAETGKLAGKTIAVKDNIAVAGVPMMNGSRILEGYVADSDATVVTRVLDEGASILGKAACECFCFTVGGSSWTCDTGPVLNPHDETRTSGGSSSGCAALVAGREVDMAIGADQGGSIRMPASWSGIVGLKPTFGLVPYTGALSMETTIDILGPMTRTVADCATLLEVMAGYDEGRDSRQFPHIDIPEYSSMLNCELAGKRVGVLREGFEACTEMDVMDRVRCAIDQLKCAGAEVCEVSVPEHEHACDIILPIFTEGIHHCMIKANGRNYGHSGYSSPSVQDAMWKSMNTRQFDLSGSVKTTWLTAKYLDRLYSNKFYNKAQNLRPTFRKAYDRALEHCDVIIMPTMPFKAPKLPMVGDEPENSMKYSTNMTPFNLTGHPALSINTGNSQGLPVGMQIVGRHFDEVTVLQIAQSYEKLRDSEHLKHAISS